MIAWLKTQTEYPKFIWESEGEGIAGSGAAEIFHEIPEGGAFYFGYAAFENLGRDQIWKEFPETFFFQPRVLMRGKIAANLPTPRLNLEPREMVPTPERWTASCNQALAHITSKAFQKGVLARRASFNTQHAIDPYEILGQLKGKIRFLLQLSPELTFLGATPERLYRREGRTITVDAVAGTCTKESRMNLKERREFDFVKEFISETLAELAKHLKWNGEDRILEAGELLHLHNRCVATLKSAVTDRELIKHLHPTPAIGGLPKEAAREFLERSELFERGLYAAPIGWISKESADFAIGIRSALISKNQMHLFSGAGIVEGSNPEHEWAELNHKISQYMRFIYE